MQQFVTTLGKKPADVRAGTGGLIAGLEEGLKTMKVGGVRRLYIPGALAFPKGLPSSPGTPRVPPLTDVVFDLQLVYIPGLDDDDDDGGAPAPAPAEEEAPAPAEAEAEGAEGAPAEA